MFGIIFSGTSTPLRFEDFIIISPTASLDNIFLFLITIFAPINKSIFIRPLLVLLSPTFFIKISELSAKIEATMMNEAEEKSPGTI